MKKFKVFDDFEGTLRVINTCLYGHPVSSFIPVIKAAQKQSADKDVNYFYKSDKSLWMEKNIYFKGKTSLNVK